MTSSSRLYRKYFRSTGTSVFVSVAYSAAVFNLYFDVWAATPTVFAKAMDGCESAVGGEEEGEFEEEEEEDVFVKYFMPFFPSMRLSEGCPSISTILVS